MAKGFAVKLRVELRPSRYLQLFIGLSYLLTALVWLMTPVDWFFRLSAALLLLGYAVLQIQKLTGEKRISRISFHTVTGWHLTRCGLTCAATLNVSFYMTAWLVVASFQLPGGKKETLVLLPDSLDQTEFRHLRVRLLHLANAGTKQ
ncbi:MAG: protein YgfX [Gammaproteobacteria bacterium]